MDRKLAAILAADVVGFSRLMSLGETETLQALKSLTEAVTTPTVTRHQGRVFKTMGDGFLAEFASVFAATECAQSIQSQIAERSAGVADNRRLVLRIGIHLGEVVVDGDDLVGDGVNIAARIEGTADPGGVNLSRAAYDNLRGRMPGIDFEDLGEVALKNIDEPMQLFRLVPAVGDTRAAPRRERRTGSPRAARPRSAKSDRRRWLWPVATASALAIAAAIVGGLQYWQPGPAGPRQQDGHDPIGEINAPPPSLAVLPFESLSGETLDSGLVEGLPGAISLALDPIPNLELIRQADVRSLPADVRSPYDVAEALGVRYLLVGTMQAADDQVRATAELLDAESGESMWSDRFDISAADPFAVQDLIAGEAAVAVLTALIDGEQALIPWEYTDVPEAYESYLLGMEELDQLTKESAGRAIDHFEAALAHDPGFLPARIRLAWVHFTAVSWGWSDAVVADLLAATEIADEVLAADPALSTAHALRAQLHLWDGRYDEALEASRRSIELSPNNAENTIMAAIVALHAGAPEETIGLARRALELSPYPPAWYYTVLAETRRRQGDPRGALGLLNAIRSRLDHALPIELQTLWTAQDAGNTDMVERTKRRVMELSPGFSVRQYMATMPSRTPEIRDRIGMLLREAGLPE